MIPIVTCALGTVQRGLVRGVVRVGNGRTSRDHSDKSIVKIGQNTEKSPGDLRRLAVTQTPVKDDQLKLV